MEVKRSLVLAGDVGGTKTTLGLFEAKRGTDGLVNEAAYSSKDFATFEAAVRAFLKEGADAVEYACFGVAGPVVDGEVKVTNLPWSVDERKVSSELGIPFVRVINDLQAAALAIPYLPQVDFRSLGGGAAERRGETIAVIAPGTGLGEASVTWDAPSGRYNVHASEGGHADFAPTDDLQVGLLRYLMGRIGHVSYESVCSGLGIRNVHTYLDQTKSAAAASEEHRRQIDAEEDPVPLMAEAAIAGSPRCDLCLKTFEVFVSILGAEAGNLALRTLARGGIYVGGGIPPRILPLLENGRFMASFRNKGRLSALVSEVPVRVVLNPRAGFLGAARFGIDQATMRSRDDGLVQEKGKG